MNVLTTRRGQYRQAALSAKRENNDAKALEYVKIAKVNMHCCYGSII